MPGGLQIRVSLADQTLSLIDGDTILRSWPVSTSRFGPGTEEGSFKTPLGRFMVCEKFGDGEPRFTIFRSRQPEGLWSPGDPNDADLVLTRILRLDGLDADNANTYERYIYIHGTNHEDRIGSPSSHGCIRMHNDHVLQLHDLTPLGTPVTIRE
jgi:hypothetical protein